MAELEKVIKELEKEVADALIPCKPKGYMFNFELIESALSLLKAQEPRVMTLDELKNSSDCPCWFESHGTYMGKKGFWIIPYMFSVTGMMSYVFPLMQTDERGNTHYSELGTYVYGKVWRCWTSRPTDEQREECEK